MGGRIAVRKGEWKLVRYQVNLPEKETQELYNLTNDLGEENNIAAEHPEVVIELNALIQASHVPNPDFPFASEGAVQ